MRRFVLVILICLGGWQASAKDMKNDRRPTDKGGMGGLRTSVDSCYVLAKTTLKKSTLEYCYLLDQVASQLDAASSLRFNIPQDNYWHAETALSRTIGVMNLMHTDAAENTQTFKYWASLMPVAWQEFNSPKH